MKNIAVALILSVALAGAAPTSASAKSKPDAWSESTITKHYKNGCTKAVVKGRHANGKKYRNVWISCPMVAPRPKPIVLRPW